MAGSPQWELVLLELGKAVDVPFEWLPQENSGVEAPFTRTPPLDTTIA